LGEQDGFLALAEFFKVGAVSFGLGILACVISDEVENTEDVDFVRQSISSCR
jgi:hypothetical protein